MKKQHMTPCKECPFRRESAAGYLGALSWQPKEYLAAASSDETVACHLHVKSGDVDTPKYETLPQCVGRAIYFKNQCKVPRTNQRFIDLVNSVTRSDSVFTWPTEFIAHHSRKII